jgi:uncharacterized membrane protein YczE
MSPIGAVLGAYPAHDGVSMTRGEEQVQLNLILTLIFTAVVIGGVVDIILDGPDQWLSVHVVFEVILVGLSLGSALYLGRGWYRSMRSVEVLEGALEERGGLGGRHRPAVG